MRTSGLSVQSGAKDVCTFMIPHGLSFKPFYISVNVASYDAINGNGGAGNAQAFYITADETNIFINYSKYNPPLAGTDNLSWYWYAKCN